MTAEPFDGVNGNAGCFVSARGAVNPRIDNGPKDMPDISPDRVLIVPW